MVKTYYLSNVDETRCPLLILFPSSDNIFVCFVHFVILIFFLFLFSSVCFFNTVFRQNHTTFSLAKKAQDFFHLYFHHSLRKRATKTAAKFTWSIVRCERLTASWTTSGAARSSPAQYLLTSRPRTAILATLTHFITYRTEAGRQTSTRWPSRASGRSLKTMIPTSYSPCSDSGPDFPHEATFPISFMSTAIPTTPIVNASQVSGTACFL